MPKMTDHWVLFTYKSRDEWIPLSKSFKTRKEAEKARREYPEREHGRIGIGVIRKEA